MKWLNDLNDSILNIVKKFNILSKLLSFDNNDNPNNFNNYYEVVNKNKDSIQENLEKFNEVTNVASQMIKTCMLSINRFSNRNTTEVIFNDILDNLGYLDSELCISEFFCNLNKDIRITNASKCVYDIVYLNDNSINTINFNTISKVFRSDITHNSVDSISDDSLKTIINGDIISNIKISVPIESDTDWKDKVLSLYNNTFSNPVNTDKSLIPSTHYNNTSITPQNKEVSEIYNKGVISFK